VSSVQGLGLRQLAENTAVTLGRQLIAGVLQLISVVIVARSLGPEGNGQYAVALLLPSMLATFLNMGISPANVYYLGAGKVDTLTAFRTIIRLVLIITLTGLLLGAVCILYFGESWFPDVPNYVLWTALALFPFALFQTFLASIFQGRQQFKTFNLILLAQPTLFLALLLIMPIFSVIRLEYVVFACLISNIVTVCISLFKVRKEISPNTDSNIQSNYSKHVISYGLRAHLSNILAFVNYKADIFIINLIVNPAAAGIYVIAVQIVERLWLVSQSVSTVILPRLSELSSNEESRKQLTPIICRMVLAVTLVLALLLGTLAYPLVVIIFGKAYTESVRALLLLLPGIVAGSGARVLANDIAARGRPELNMYFSAIVVVINVSGNVLLIPEFNLSGAAMATTIAYIVNFLLRLIVYQKISGNRFVTPLFITRQDVSRIKNTLTSK